MNMLSRLKLSQKLVLLVVLPIIIMLSFAFYQSYLAFSLYSSSSKLEQMVELGIRVSNLVHESQKERGMSAGYIGSKGEKFASEIVTQRQAMDEKLDILKQYLTELDTESMSHHFAKSIDKLLERLDALGETREAITSLKMPLNQALAYYTGNNNTALSLIEEMATLAPEQKIAIMISGYANFLNGKERAGIERAVLTNTFSKNHFGEGMFQKFLELVTIQKTYTNAFLAMASGEAKSRYDDVLKDPNVIEVDRIRSIALSNGKRTELVNQLNIALGYGGMIHRFKNYVLRSKAKDLASVQQNAKSAILALDQYAALPAVSEKVLEDIQAVRDTVNNYSEAAENISAMKQSGMQIAEIDSIVKISDGAALKAIKQLGQGHFDIDPTYWFKTITVKINLLKDFENSLADDLLVSVLALKSSATVNLVVIALVSLAGLLVSVGLSLLISKNLRQQIGGEPSDIEAIAQQIAEGSLHLEDGGHGGQSSGIYAAMTNMQQKLSQVIEQDIQKIVNSARKGDLSRRINLSDKSGFYETLAEGVNDLVDSSEAIINDNIRVFSSLANGDLSQTITREYEGSFNQLKNDANTTIEKLNQVIQGDIKSLIESAVNGDLGQRIDLSDKQGFFKELSSGINQLVESVDSIFEDTTAAMESMSQGDLTKSLTNNYVGQFDSLKININSTMANLEDTITRLSGSSNNVNLTSKSILDGSNNLSARTEQQASALEETAASMEELTSTVKNNADNAVQAEQLASSAKTSTEHGGEIMHSASEAMAEINQSSLKIAEIISVIDEIAFQTNLLALNASVEAARAGDQGRGFAVVATEVRNLAGRSATAAKEIKELINDSVSKVQVGVTLVDQSKTSQAEIVESMDRVSSIISEIALASREQAEGIEQVNQAVASLDEVTQQNAALAEETSAAASSLTEEAATMGKMIDFFTIENKPVVASSAPVRSAPQTVSRAPVRPAPAKPAPAKPALKATNAVSDNDDDWEEF